jgi:hypothetical protein
MIKVNPNVFFGVSKLKSELPELMFSKHGCNLTFNSFNAEK